MRKTRAATTCFRRVSAVWAAIVLVSVCSSATPSTTEQADQPVTPRDRAVQPSKRVDFRLQDGVRITGTLTTWNEDGIDGSFGRRAWTELKADDAWRLYIALADRTNAADWINLGRVMLAMPESDARAEHAFRRALQIDPSCGGQIVEARARAERQLAEREEAERMAAEARLRTTSPEAGPWPSELWPSVSPEEHAAATAALKARANDILQAAGLSLAPIETDLIVMYSDAPRKDAAMWVIRMERAYARLARLFEIDSRQNIFHGKLLVFAFADQDRYRLVEAAAFQQLVPVSADGLCHFDGPAAMMCLHAQKDPDKMLWTTLRQFTHAFMHRLRSPARLPAWANEGLASFIASQEMVGTLLEKDHRAAAIEFIRGGGNVIELLDRTYEQFDWTETWTRFTDVSALVVELMASDRPQQFVQWVYAVKRGQPWREALKEMYGIEPRAVIDTATRHYMLND